MAAGPASGKGDQQQASTEGAADAGCVKTAEVRTGRKLVDKYH
jgi:hypothetical protein